VVAEGSRAACEALLDVLRSTGTPGQVSDVAETWSAATGASTRFVVR
jgi:acylphosphatase